MAHLHRCDCGRLFRCEGVDHAAPAWYRCSFQCPDRTLHGFSLGFVLDAEFLRLEPPVRGIEVVEVPRRRRDPRCRSRAQGQRQPREVAHGD